MMVNRDWFTLLALGVAWVLLWAAVCCVLLLTVYQLIWLPEPVNAQLLRRFWLSYLAAFFAVIVAMQLFCHVNLYQRVSSKDDDDADRNPETDD